MSRSVAATHLQVKEVCSSDEGVRRDECVVGKGAGRSEREMERDRKGMKLQ
jgi:hypothetical protein